MCTLYAMYMSFGCALLTAWAHTHTHKNKKKTKKKHKTLLSLSKLSMLASDSTDTETLQTLNRELQVIEFQQNIPTEALEVSCANWQSMWVFPALSFPVVLQVKESWVARSQAGYSLFSSAGKWSSS